MALEPRFRLTAALDRKFVNREEVIVAFSRQWSSIGAGPRVFNPVGVGGVGKSRLLRQLREHNCPGVRTAVLDLQIPAMRQQEDALAVLRTELGRQGVRFHRFDIAYAVLWQRLHPHLRISRSDLPFVVESEVLSQIVDTASGMSVFGTAVGLLRVMRAIASKAKRRHRIAVDETLSSLDDLSNAELVDSVTYLFAQDLRESSLNHPYAVFIDAYEALVPSPVRTARAAMADAWLRDLVAQLDRGLTVLASREPLAWDRDDAEWALVVTTVPVGELPMRARLELLASYGVTQPEEQHAIAVASAGLPFYLNLAVDSALGTAETSARRVVSSEEILRRFLQHVGDREARILELLAVARVFDLAIFRSLTVAFGLPHDQLTWDALTSYSFVYPSGSERLRLHQLMRESLQRRLPAAVIREAAALLHVLWAGRAADAELTDPLLAAAAYRESAYHGLQAETLSAEALLGTADSVFKLGGRPAADGVLGDLQRHVSHLSRPEIGDLAETARCLEAEAAKRLGDATRILDLARTTAPDLATAAGARFATTVADAHRMVGRTGAAQRLYRDIWTTHAGPARNRAGIWLADIDMCQGRFTDAEVLSGQILAAIDPDDHLTRADVHRLLHLAHRFAMDFPASKRELDAAEHACRMIGSTFGQARLATNRAELLAWTGAPDAVDAAVHALAAQRDIGDQAEIGKAYTALAIAQLHRANLEETVAALHSAQDALDKARYRSGRARAELIRACAHIVAGGYGDAVSSVKWAVSELVATEVYPTLVIFGDLLLSQIDAEDRCVQGAATAARAQIGNLRVPTIETRILDLIRQLVGSAL